MRNPIKFYILLLPLLLLFSCEKNTPEEEFPDTDPLKIKRTVVIYAVNNSSLSSDFNFDSREMLTAAAGIDLTKYHILLYRTVSDTQCGLFSIERDKVSGQPFYFQLRSYNRDKTSTHPDRVKEVLEYSLSIYPNSTYDLVFWGHGTSWKPYFDDHHVSYPESYAYGGEYNGEITGGGSKDTDWIEINELAKCVPDSKFDTIWFDCCYMTGIEVIYEFRNKCKTFVGYPTEVWSDGLPYDLVLPYFFKENHNMIDAAKEFYHYYAYSGDPVTVAVINMNYLERVADITQEIILSGNLRPESSELLNYSRDSNYPFYDFRQFFSKVAELNDRSELIEELNNSLSLMVEYHAESSKNFNHKPWDTSNISGISTHFYRGGSGLNEDFYHTLSWYKRVY